MIPRNISRALRPACCFFLCAVALAVSATAARLPTAPVPALQSDAASLSAWQVAQATASDDAPAATDTTPPPPDLKRTSLSYKAIAGWTIAFMLSTSAAFAIWAGLMIYKTNKRKS